MKHVFFFLTAIIMVFSSCKKDTVSSDSSDVTAFKAHIAVNSWRASYFLQNGVDSTNSLTGYSFIFNTNGTVTATKNSIRVDGTWSAGTDDSKIKFTLLFSAAGAFSESSEDWLVFQQSETSIRLQHVSKGSTIVDLLNFERN